jgi:hypothetical protein
LLIAAAKAVLIDNLLAVRAPQTATRPLILQFRSDGKIDVTWAR